MPNYVKSIISCKDIAKMDIFTKNDYGNMEFDFQKIVPRPKPLEDVGCGSKNQCSIYYFITNRMNTVFDDLKRLVCYRGEVFPKSEQSMIKEIDSLSETEKDELFLLGKKRCENISNYGFPDWYSWSTENWGTKWNACETEIVDDDTVVIDTAWSAPLPVVTALSKMHPDKIFTITYADEDAGANTGSFIVCNGNLNGNHYQDYCEKGRELFIKCWGYDPFDDEEE